MNETEEARAWLASLSTSQVTDLASVLAPAVKSGHAGPYSLLALNLIAEALAARE
jgi:hypothetical protein